MKPKKINVKEVINRMSYGSEDRRAERQNRAKLRSRNRGKFMMEMVIIALLGIWFSFLVAMITQLASIFIATNLTFIVLFFANLVRRLIDDTDM